MLIKTIIMLLSFLVYLYVTCADHVEMHSKTLQRWLETQYIHTTQHICALSKSQTICIWTVGPCLPLQSTVRLSVYPP